MEHDYEKEKKKSGVKIQKKKKEQTKSPLIEREKTGRGGEEREVWRAEGALFKTE